MSSNTGERIDSIIDIPAVEAEIKQLLSFLDQLGIRIKESGTASGNDSFTETMKQRKDAMKQMSAEADKMALAEKELDNQMNKVVATAKEAVGINTQTIQTIKGYNGTLDENIRLQVQYKMQLADVKDRQKELSKDFTGTAAAASDYQSKMVALVKQEKELQAANQELNTVIRNQVKEMNAAGNSLNELRAELNQLKAAGNSLDIGSKEFEETQGQIAALNQKIKELEFARGDFQRDVGNYAGSFKGAFDVLQNELTETRTKLKQMSGDQAGFQELAKQEQLLTELTEQLNKTFGSTKQEYRALQEAAKQLGIELGSTNASFQAFVEEVGAAKDELDDIGAIIKQRSSDTKILDGIIAAAEGLAGAYGVAAGSAALFGDDSEELQKQMVKLQAIMSIIQGLQAVQNALQKESAAMQFLLTIRTSALAAAQRVYALMTAGATAATIALRTALISLGLGAFVVLLAVLVNKIESWTSSTSLNAEQQKDLADNLGRVNAALIEQSDLLDSQNQGYKKYLENQIALGQAAGQNAYQQLALQKLLAEEERKNAQERIDNLEASNKKQSERFSQIQSYNNKLLLATTAYDQAVKDGDDRKKESLNKLIDIYQSSISALKPIYEAGEKARNDLFAANQKGFQLEASEAKLSADEQRKVALESVKAQTALIIDKNQRILASEESTLQQRLDAIRKVADAQRAASKAEADNVINDPTKTNADRVIAQRNYNTALVKIERDKNEQIQKTQETYSKRSAAAYYEMFKTEKELRLKALDITVNDEYLSYEKRLAAYNDYVNNQKQLIDAEYNYRKLQKGLTDEEILLLEKDHEAKLIALSMDANIKITEMSKAEWERRIQIRESLHQSEVELWNNANAVRNMNDSKQYKTEVLALNKALQDKLISVEEYNKKREKLDYDYQLKSLDNQIKNARDLLAVAIAGTQEKYDLEKKISDLEIQRDDMVTNKKIANRQKLRDAELQLADEVGNLIGSVVDGQFEKEKNQLQQRIDLIDQTKQAQIDRINAEQISEQDKAAKIAQITAQAEADKQVLEQKQRQADLKKARFDRAMAIAKIIENTAIGITAALASLPPNVPLSYIIGAIGAAQIAAVVAKPIPTYYTGTENAAAGWALTDELGPELYIEPDGNMYMGNDKPTIRNVKGGTKIIKADQVNDYLHSLMIKNTAASLGYKPDNKTAEKIDGLKAGMRDMIYWQTNELKTAYKEAALRKQDKPTNMGKWEAYFESNLKQ